jgi:aminoacylase
MCVHPPPQVWWVRVRTTGPAGHGSRFVENTATEKLHRVITHFLGYRAEQKAAYESACGCGKTLGDFTTVNLTSLRAGVPGGGGLDAYNVVPTAAEAGFDVRIPATVDLVEFRARLDGWCAEEGVSYELVAGTAAGAMSNPVTPLTPDNVWWTAFEASLARAGARISTSVFPAATDSRFVRALGIPALGFSPIANTPILLHDHDERLGVDEFLRGIDVYETLIPDLANV